ncbi:hypothetical protein [Marinifilum caeruleilacunae]|uniref:YcxB family protein n=1 Tax=Marinifilum caeruleilacunae TaxID=2499076 RepID=A0ABX1WUR8_9BACT|nr:hypothetical protein [Marinifilum caeruleilacunae]NOU59663.1 hypothetical protein [Marinifilum caeruleilacunae]
MTEEDIKYSMETGELKLSNWDRITHFSLPGFLLLMPLMTIFIHLRHYLKGSSIPLEGENIWVFIIFGVIPASLGVLFYKIQKNRLQFKSIETKLSRAELATIIEDVSARLEWTPVLIENNIIIAKTSPGFFSGSWGEQITVLFDKDKVLVNSICDPNKRSSVVSMGRNKKNMNGLLEEIRKANR